MKTKITLLIVLMVILWASPALGVELNELPELSYEIDNINTGPLPNYKWTTQNSFLLAMRLIDWKQTLKIAMEYETTYVSQKNSSGGYYAVEKQVPKYKEYNPILGENPTESEVNRYFLIMVGLDGFFYYKACNDSRWIKFNNIWIKFNSIVSFGCVGNNFRIGINLN